MTGVPRAGMNLPPRFTFPARKGETGYVLFGNLAGGNGKVEAEDFAELRCGILRIPDSLSVEERL